MKFTEEQLKKAAECKSVEELLELARTEGIELAKEEAEKAEASAKALFGAGADAEIPTTELTSADLAEDGGLLVCGPFYKAPGKSGKTMTPEFYRFVVLQNYHTETAAGGVATHDPGSFLSGKTNQRFPARFRQYSLPFFL